MRTAQTFVEAGRCFVRDGCPDLAAALAFYSLFSMAPLLVVLVRLLSIVLSPERVEPVLVDYVGALIGQSGADQVRQIVATLHEGGNTGTLPALVSMVLALFGATTVVVQLQDSLNRVWNVERTGSWVRSFLVKRVLSTALLGGVALLLVVSVSTTVGLEGARQVARAWTPTLLVGPVVAGIDLVASWLVFSVVFAVVFRFLPDVRIRWRHVGLGAVATSALFVVGKLAIGQYLGALAVGSPYGAAGSLAAVLTWVFYSSLILLYGAELTQVWAHRLGQPLEPLEGARWIPPR